MVLKRLIFTAVFVFICNSLYASSVLELMGAVDAVNPLTARIISTGAEAAYFNPSYIVSQEDSFKLGFGMMIQSKTIEHFSRPKGYDVSSEIYQASSSEISGNGKYVPKATAGLLHKRGSENYDYDTFDGIITIGAVKSIIKNWVGAGIYALIPVAGIQTQEPFYNDEREQYFSNSLHFELYGDRLKQFSMAFALGGKVSDFLKLGVGLSVSTYTVTQNRVFVPDGGDPSTQIINSQMKVGSSVSPYFSFVANPFLGLNLTGTFHFPRNTGVVELNNEMQVWNWDYDDGKGGTTKKGYLESSSLMTAGYEPIKFSIGMFYEINLGGYILSPMAAFEWARWSTYINRHGEKPADKWKDTFSGCGGLILTHRQRKAALDIAYIPSPVPAQDGRENYVDNDRLGFSLGYTEYFHFEKFSIGGGISSSAQWLLARTENKDKSRSEEDGGLVDEFPDDASYYGSADGATAFNNAKTGLQTNNPGFPGWKSKGFVMGVGISLEVLY
ncbi:MAG TPA: hypothetical protein PKG52_02640 [bacterium]|nr:hypothetical protein [bacterium]HPS29497.1 hypothetical protein [bacterium]